MVDYVSNLNEFQEIIRNSGNKLVVIDFTATWCPPCKAIAPHFEALSQKYQGRAIFLKVDVDDAQDVARFSSVSSMPTFHFYRNGTRVAEFSGADPSKLDRTVEQFAPSSSDISFGGGGQRLGASSNEASAPPQGSTSMREAAALAAQRRIQQLAATQQATENGDSSDKPNSNNDEQKNNSNEDASKSTQNATSKSSNDGNDARLKVNQVLVKQMVDEMGFPRIRSEKALILTGNKNLEDAVEWCFEHADDEDIDEPLQIVSGEEVKDKKPDSNKPKLSKEDVKKRADELYAKARAKRETEEKKETVEREKQRMKSGKEIAIAKQKLEEQERRRAVEEKRRQKREDLAERQRVRQMLEADKEARRRKFKMPNSNPSSQQPQQKPEPVVKPSQPSKPPSSGKIQFKLPDGSKIEGEFSAQQTMNDVVSFLTTSKPELASKSLMFSQQYPRKVLSSSEYNSSLTSLNLLPRGTLVVSFS